MSAFLKSRLAVSAAVLAVSLSLSGPAFAQASSPDAVAAAVSTAAANGASDAEIAAIVDAAIAANPAQADEIVEAALAVAPPSAVTEIADVAEAAGVDTAAG